MKIMKKLFFQITCIAILLSFMLSTVFANTTSFQIISEDGIYYIEDPEFPMNDLVVYCMNNLLNWPHKVGSVEPPNYQYGYLDSKDIENYDEMIQKLKKILFAGYPHNGKNLYKIIEDEELYVPSEEEFNDLLNPLPELVKAFPDLGYNDFTIDNFNHHKDLLNNFYEYVVFTMKDTDIKEGLTKSSIMSMPFFKAMLCLLNFSEPREAFAHFYSNSYYVTEQQAFNNTQSAIWKLMSDYKVPDNNITSLSSYPLGQTLVNYADSTEVVLETEPDEVKITGDFNFTKGRDGRWYSGEIKIEEPENYNGIYALDLPEGISVLNVDPFNIYGDTKLTLVSDDIPDINDEFIIWNRIMWGPEPRQYSPSEEVYYNGKKYQNMVGLNVNSTYMSSEFTYRDVATGKLIVNKIVDGNIDDTLRDFTFTVTLSDNTINGTYGDMEFKNGAATFTLKHAESKTATGIPVGIDYTVKESNNDGYTIESQNANGTILSNKVESVTFTNRRNPSKLTAGSLMVEKKVSGIASDVTKPFTFTVTLSDKTINGTYGDMEFKNGVAIFKLRHEESKTATGIPTGTTYTVTESDNDGYTVESQNENGTINSDQTSVATFMNIKDSSELPIPPTGILSVEKIVLNYAGDTNEDFNFTVTLSDNTLNGTYGDMEFKNGVSEFTMKHGQVKTAIGLPVGISYMVTESDNDEYIIESQNANGTIIENKWTTAIFSNTKKLATGNLSVQKTVSGNAADTNKAFTFTVTLSDNTLNGTYGEMEFKNGVATFTLKHNESKSATGLPVGISYMVTESDNEGYTVEAQNASGSIIENETIYASFTNTKNLAQLATGNLSVQKTVSGNAADTNKAFTFTVTLSDNTLNGTYGEMEFKNGIATFTLKHNESKTATGLPVGISYTVTESDNEGYTVEAQNASGSIIENETISASFTNTKDSEQLNNILPPSFESPDSGDNSSTLLWLSILILSSIAIIVSFIIGRKKIS